MPDQYLTLCVYLLMRLDFVFVLIKLKKALFT